VGAEGLPVKAGDNILLADTPNDFANSVIFLLSDPNQRKRLATSARTLVQAKYSWPGVAESFARTLRDAVTSFRPRNVGK